MKTKEAKKQGIKSVIIANPIYDTVFKRLMENQRIAKFFLSTILEQEVEDISVLPQEFTRKTDIPKGKKKKGKIEYYSILRLDFMATICTDDGKRKKILIEVQKSWDTLDVMRFREYLGEQYKKEEIIDGEKIILPITTIYILGNNLSEIKCPCIKVGRTYIDMINKTLIDKKSEFIEQLTNDSYVIQAGRITDVRYATNLDKLLSIFEQDYFVVRGSDVMKEYRYHPDDENMALITDILHEMASNAEERKEIEGEREVLRILNNAKDPLKQTIEKQVKSLEEKDKTIEEKDKTIEEKDKKIEEKDKTIEEKDKMIAEKDKKIAELELLRDKQVK
ncbi:MAG: hypothetical protein LBS55_00900 [Prevotellaceae bacterium]|jgi:hypothetical protein|nr:hypothetical protein [Prevotellaceae bacterium]